MPINFWPRLIFRLVLGAGSIAILILLSYNYRTDIRLLIRPRTYSTLVSNTGFVRPYIMI
jgi:hypothetical protein